MDIPAFPPDLKALPQIKGDGPPIFLVNVQAQPLTGLFRSVQQRFADSLASKGVSDKKAGDKSVLQADKARQPGLLLANKPCCLGELGFDLSSMTVSIAGIDEIMRLKVGFQPDFRRLIPVGALHFSDDHNKNLVSRPYFCPRG